MAGRLLKLKGMHNTRDLGGIETKYGIIKEDCLFRSGQLYFAEPSDIELLSEIPIRRIIDFRSYREREEKPDLSINGAENIHLPIVRDLTALMKKTDNEGKGESFGAIAKRILLEENFGMQYMIDSYLEFVRSPFSVSQYARFLDLVLSSDGAVLWHCTAGKDRTGFATVIILKILGASDELILSDYLETNQNIREENEKIIEIMNKVHPMEGKEDRFRLFFSAREEFIKSLFNAVNEDYGGFDSFMEHALKFDEDKQKRLREKFLVY